MHSQHMQTLSYESVCIRTGVFHTAACIRKTYSVSSNTLDVRLNLQQARQNSTMTMIYEDKELYKNVKIQVQNIKCCTFLVRYCTLKTLRYMLCFPSLHRHTIAPQGTIMYQKVQYFMVCTCKGEKGTFNGMTPAMVKCTAFAHTVYWILQLHPNETLLVLKSC